VYTAFATSSHKTDPPDLHTDRHSKEFDGLMHPEEAMFVRALAQVEQMKTVDPSNPSLGILKQRAFLRNLETVNKYIAPLPSNIDLTYKYHEELLSAVHGNGALDYLVNNNRPVQAALGATMKELIGNMADTPTSDIVEAFNELISTLGVRVGTHAKKNRIASQLSTSNAIDMSRNILLVASMNEYYRFRWDRNIAMFALENVFDAITLKLLLPAYMVDKSSRNRIDNTIALHLLRGTLRYRNAPVAGALAQPARLQSGEINLLNLMFDSGAISAAASAEIRPFLYSDANGSGWLGAGQTGFTTTADIADSATYMNRRADGVFYNYMTGQPFEEGDVVEQFARFQLFFTYITGRGNLRFPKPNDKAEDSLAALLERINISGDRMSDYVFQFEQRTRQLNLTALARPLSPVASMETDGYFIKAIDVPALAGFSFLALATVESMLPPFMGPEILEYGWAIRREAEELVYHLHYAERTFPKHKMSRKDRIEYAFSQMNFSTGFDVVLKDSMLGSTNYLSLKIPSFDSLNPYWHRRDTLAAEFARRMHQWLGYADKFYFDPDARIVHDHIYKTEYKRRNIEPAITINEKQLREHLRRKTLTATLKQAMLNRELICFDMHIQFDTQEYLNSLKSFEQDDPFTTMETPSATDKDIRLLKVTMFKQLNEVFFSDSANTTATFIPPRWFVDEDPSIRSSVAQLLTDFHVRMPSLRSEVTLYNDVTFIDLASI
jgi:hypothetical protein